jgi:hypothetical protein
MKINPPFLRWWLEMTLEEKFYKVIPWLKSKGMSATEIHPFDLKERGIKEIFHFHNEPLT